MSKTVRITWIDSATLGVLGTKIYRNDIEIGDVGNGIQTFDDINAVEGTTYKYEVQAYTSTLESTDENIGVNVDTIDVSGGAITPTNYVFDGATNSYMKDKGNTMLDGIVNQTWVMRVKRTVNTHQHGFLGCDNNATALKLEVDAGDDRMDALLQDSGASSFTNGIISTDLGWHIYSLYYDGTDLGCYQDGVFVKSSPEPGFTGRTAGRILAVGAAVIGGGTPGWLIGEISDVQFYNRSLSDAEQQALGVNLDSKPTDHATSLVADFSGQKTESGGLASDWTSEVNGHVLENKGTVTYN